MHYHLLNMHKELEMSGKHWHYINRLRSGHYETWNEFYIDVYSYKPKWINSLEKCGIFRIEERTRDIRYIWIVPHPDAYGLRDFGKLWIFHRLYQKNIIIPLKK